MKRIKHIRPWRIKGHDVAITDAAGSASDTIDLVASDGDVIGISVAENYARVDMGKIKVSIDDTNNAKPLIEVPLTQLLPDGERQFYPLAKPLPKQVLDITIKSTSANSLAANPITLIFHYDDPQTCEE